MNEILQWTVLTLLIAEQVWIILYWQGEKKHGR
ncbi:hypothetical protein ES703_79579 [subsurface metagenome]